MPYSDILGLLRQASGPFSPSATLEKARYFAVFCALERGLLQKYHILEKTVSLQFINPC